MWRVFGFALVLSEAVLVIVIDVSTVLPARLGDSIEVQRKSFGFGRDGW